MNKKLNTLFLTLLITIGLFIYLTLHHYAVKLGLSGNSLCSINEKLNCDAAATSSFSELLGIPVAILGASFHLILFGFILFLKFDWFEKGPYSLATLRFLLLLAAVTSVVMGIISVVYVKVYCPFCMATYLFSFINLVLGWNLFSNTSQSIKPEKLQFLNYFTIYRSHLILLLTIPVLAWVVNGMLQENYGLTEMKKIIPEKIMQWRASPEYTFNPAEGLIKKGSDSKVTLVEFADFKCPHCKNASTTIDAFLKGNPKVTFIFKPFPLDGSCNKAISTKGDGTRCTLAAWTLCAEKNEQRGWDVHHWIFEKQEELSQVVDLKPYLAELEKDLKINAAQLASCSDSTETYELMYRLAEEGNKAQVSGTPAIYMNGKKLPYGQFLDILKTAAQEFN